MIFCGIKANSTSTDQTPQAAASDQGHRLLYENMNKNEKFLLSSLKTEMDLSN